MSRSGYKYHEYIDCYIDSIESGKKRSSNRIKKAMRLVKRKLDKPHVFIDSDQIYDAKRIIEEHFQQKIIDWELFVLSLCLCYYEDSDTVVFDEIYIEMGRGNGKNGFISMLIWYFTTPNHGIDEYDVDIVANSEDQAKRSFGDVYKIIGISDVLPKMFQRTKVEILNVVTNSTIHYNTSNARTKDSLRSACLVFDEVHEYENFDLIDVFMSGFGKKKHSRTFYITTNGFVRGGVLDTLREQSDRILDGEEEGFGFLPLIYCLDAKEEVHDEANWIKANPSYDDLPYLRIEMQKAYRKMKTRPNFAITFYTKRCNIPAQDNFTVVATPEQVKATNRDIPYNLIRGMACVGAVDYASIRDFASVGLLFRLDDEFVLLEHTFVCHRSLKLESRHFKFPVEEMAERGLITIVEDETIKPEYISAWFLEKRRTYDIRDIKMDEYRKAHLESEFNRVGLPYSSVRSGVITHAKLAPLVDSIFAENRLILGDNPTMRWYINNVKQDMDKKGNISYLKIEPQLRKTDGFFMLLHALNDEAKLPQATGAANFFSMDPVFYN